MRLFAALQLPPPIRDQLLDLMGGQESLRWQDEEQLHITLRFMGELERPQAEDVAASLASIRFEPFSLHLAGVGRFAQRRGGALWAGIEPREPLAHLAAKVDRACVAAGLEPEHRAYHPHITLARWSGREPDLSAFLHQHAALGSELWTVDRFVLFESHLLKTGAFYEPVATYPAARS